MGKRVSVRLGRGAKADLRTIRDYLTEKAGSVTADTFTRTILDLVDKLEQFPERGPIPEEIGGLGIKGIRQISARPYRIIYSYSPGKVTILMIVDGRRDLKPLLLRRLLR